MRIHWIAWLLQGEFFKTRPFDSCHSDVSYEAIHMGPGPNFHVPIRFASYIPRSERRNDSKPQEKVLDALGQLK
ncbi:hypothetical protein DSCW_51760 [Desulfosarcina widdelii]|uniref:Uncharacterized protein n=1 Tax=Desulfosarcina widdelii TaxID=947919 RepID=A0A5K7ZC68_9BACT|nr:hypothetical protein DSCW_51760 [Desulfosarcina widdelii]